MHLVQSTVRRGIAAMVLTISVLTLPAFVAAQEPEQPPAIPAGDMGVGLNGLLPAEMPAEIAEAIEGLPETWKDWGEDLRLDINALFAGEDKTIEAQQARLKSLRDRATVAGERGAQPEYAAARTQLLTLAGRLGRWLDLLEAALDTLNLAPETKQARLEKATDKVARSAQNCDTYLRTVKAGDKWGQFLEVSSAKKVAGGNTEALPRLVTVTAKLHSQMLNDEQKQFANRPAIASYASAVDEYVTLAGNVELVADNGAVRTALGSLIKAYGDYRVLRTHENALAVRNAYDAVRASALDGGERITAALRSTVFNYNLRAMITEGFLNRIVGDCRQETGAVDDCILGAKVDGCQMTVNNIGLDLQPSPCDVRWDITANGTIESKTQGVKCCATVFTQGKHFFCSRKRVIFNGDCFFTEPATISVNANNKTVGARTSLSRIPLLGGISEEIAIGRATEMRAQSEAVARERVASRALPRLNYEVDSKFGPGGETNTKFQNDVVARLTNERLYPETKLWTSTDTEILGYTRKMEANELAGSVPPPADAPATAAVLKIHDTLLNDAADKVGVGGKTLTDEQFRTELQAFVERVLNRDINFQAPPKDGEDKTITFTFHATDPIRVRLENGEFQIALRAALQREGDAALPEQIITVRMQPMIEGDKLVVEPRGVSVEPSSGMASPEQIGIALRIRDQLQKKLTRKEYSRVRNIEVNNKQVPVTLTGLQIVDGWMILIGE